MFPRKLDAEMNLEELGYNEDLEKARVEQKLEGFGIGRITAEHKERYMVKTVTGELEAEITGHMRFTAQNREDFPAVGDWVALTSFDTDFAVIHQILPRYSMIKRQAVGQRGEIQLIATNIDYAFLLQAADRDFNLNRLERYLTICHESHVKPIIVLTKVDLSDEPTISELRRKIRARFGNSPFYAISNKTRAGYDILMETIEKGKTYCMLGSSGVGKSTLINNLSGRTIMSTGSISESTNKGRHTTSHRELVIVRNGGLLIDNPGMREVGIADSAIGLEQTFDQISRLSESCKYKDCTHTTENGCAVIEALDNGELDNRSFENYLKMERERAHYESTLVQRRKKEKEFGKKIKKFKNDMKDINPKH